jgi:hypothetical protein
MKAVIGNTEYRFWFRYIRPKAKTIIVTPKKGPNKGIPAIQTIKQAPIGVQAFFVRFDAPAWRDEAQMGTSKCHEGDAFDREAGRNRALSRAMMAAGLSRAARTSVFDQYWLQRATRVETSNRPG